MEIFLVQKCNILAAITSAYVYACLWLEWLQYNFSIETLCPFATNFSTLYNTNIILEVRSGSFLRSFKRFMSTLRAHRRHLCLQSKFSIYIIFVCESCFRVSWLTGHKNIYAEWWMIQVEMTGHIRFLSVQLAVCKRVHVCVQERKNHEKGFTTLLIKQCTILNCLVKTLLCFHPNDSSE